MSKKIKDIESSPHLEMWEAKVSTIFDKGGIVVYVPKLVAKHLNLHHRQKVLIGIVHDYIPNLSLLFEGK